LLWLYGLDGAIVVDEEDARAAGLFLQGQSATIVGEPRETLDEVLLAQFIKRRQSGDLLVRQPNLTGPAAAGGAALAIVEDAHGGLQVVFVALRRTRPRRAGGIIAEMR